MTFSTLNETEDQETEDENALFGLAQPHILIVDSDHHSVLDVYDMANSFNSRVDAANGVEAALNCLEKNRYDAVITNLEMHGLSGYEIVRWLRDKSPETRVIVMTERDRAEIERYMKTGIVDHWIFKPFGINELLIALDDFAFVGPADSLKAG